MMPGREVQFAGALSYQQYRAAQRLHYNDHRGIWSMIVFFAILAVGGAILCIRESEAIWPAFGFVAMDAFILLMLGIRERSFRKTWASHKLLRVPVQGALSEDGLNGESTHGSGRVPWSEIHQWQASPNVLLIYASRNLFNVLPREFFSSDGDWMAARELVARKLPSRKGTRRWARVRDVFIWLMILGAMLLLWFVFRS